MCTEEKLADTSGEPLKTTLMRLVIVVIFSIAFAYIESAVVVYLRVIFHPEGFTFPLSDFDTILQHKALLLTEIGREAATIVLILTGAWLFGRNLQQRFAYFLTIFAVWDIFYYVWLKVLLNWPARISDWDILFLIPTAWAGPVVAPVLISITLLVFAIAILFRDSVGRGIRASRIEWLGFIAAAVVVVVSFCLAGRHIAEPDFESYFYWPVFAAGQIGAITLFVKCLLKPK
ncbi:MAG TPA: hypothetical protein VMY06_07855 [Sedimentisphaerales bacterium]|nr:hypothetical protein [Sedimentisphaerales bacterium]